MQMYCTGGIRCDVYSAFLRKQGFKHLFTLEGGIQNYLRQEGSELWNGSLFVFDGRMAIPANAAAAAAPQGALPAAVPCQLCGNSQGKCWSKAQVACTICHATICVCMTIRSSLSGACRLARVMFQS